MQSEANSYSTAIENHDFNTVADHDMLHEAKVYSWASKTGLLAITWICLCFSGDSASACCTR